MAVTSSHNMRRPARLAVGLIGLLTLITPALALEAPQPAPPPAVGAVPSEAPDTSLRIAIDDTTTGDAPSYTDRAAQELRVRRSQGRHTHRSGLYRKRAEDDDDDEKDTKAGNDKEEATHTHTGASPEKTYVRAAAAANNNDDDGDETSSSSHHATKTAEASKEKTTESAKATTGAAAAGGTKTISDNLSSETGDLSRAASSGTATATESSSTAESTESALPVPFDMTPSSAFKTSGGDNTCPDYVAALLRNETFASCYPLSMMVFSSMSFFNAKRELTSMVRVLDSTCAADVDTCSSFMTSAASSLTEEANCKQEFDAGLTLVMQVYNGLLNYRTMYSATCLQNPDTDQYCYAGAVTNTSSASDSYLYYLPYNLSLSASTTPSCSWCNRRTMDVFHAASADRDLLIAETYVGAARIFDNWCDPGFANATLADEDDGSAAGPGLVASLPAVFATALALLFFL